MSRVAFVTLENATFYPVSGYYWIKIGSPLICLCLWPPGHKVSKIWIWNKLFVQG